MLLTLLLLLFARWWHLLSMVLLLLLELLLVHCRVIIRRRWLLLMLIMTTRRPHHVRNEHPRFSRFSVFHHPMMMKIGVIVLRLISRSECCETRESDEKKTHKKCDDENAKVRSMFCASSSFLPMMTTTTTMMMLHISFECGIREWRVFCGLKFRVFLIRFLKFFLSLFILLS